MDIYDLFAKFELEILPKEWVHNLWKDDFSEAIEIPAEYEVYLENVDIGELMTGACSFLKEWLDSPDSINSSSISSHGLNSSVMRPGSNVSHIDSKSWQNLITNNVHHKALVALLSIYILRGKIEKQLEIKKLGLLATDLYLLLLAIPGSLVFNIFNPILFSHAIENLKICSVLKSTANSKPKAKKRKGKHADDDSEEEEDSEDEGELMPSDKSSVIRMLSQVLNDLLFTLKRFQLKGQDDSLLLTIQILILLTRLEHNSSSLFSKSPPHGSVIYLAYKAYKTLMDLCVPDHGEVQETVYFIMKEMMPSFLVFDTKSLNLAPKEANVVKDHSIQFLRTLVVYLKEHTYKGIKVLVQRICLKIPDKADLRARGVQVVLEILNVLPYNLSANIIIWIMNLCFSDQVRNRVTGLEITGKLLFSTNERIPTSPIKPYHQTAARTPANHNSSVNGSVNGSGSGDEDDNAIILTQQPDFSTNKYLLATLFSMCQDSSPTVRAKALTLLANVLSSNNKSIQQDIHSIFVTPYLDSASIEGCNVYEREFFDIYHLLLNINEAINAVDPLPGGRAVVDLMEMCMADEKVFVRKSAIQVLANIFLLSDKWMSSKLLQAMVHNCRDISVSVRKLLVQCLTELLQYYPNHPELPKYWVLGVMQLLADQEIKSQEKVLEALQEVILNNIVPYKNMKTDLHVLPWKLLALIAEYNKRKLFLFACHKWTLTNYLRQSLITTLRTHIETENNIAAWFLLASFSEYLDIKDPQFVLDYFYENVLYSQQVEEYCCFLVTEVIHLNWHQLEPQVQINLCDNILKQLSQFMVPLPMISRCIDMCQLISEKHMESLEEPVGVKEWGGSLLSICESQLDKLIGVNSPTEVGDETRLCQYIYTVGDVAQICPGRLKHSTLLLIQNLLIGPGLDGEDDDKEERWKGKVSACVQSVAVTTLGKLCLQREHTAKVLVPLFGSLLAETPHTEIKINVVIALTDMCIKFTSLVEKHLPEICICLRDSDLKVRENTLKLLIQLIQEDYLKMRCPVLFHLLTMLCDDDLHIRDTVSAFIINSLLVKQKNILVQHFVEALFHYNAYMGHSTYSKRSAMSHKERTVFLLEGPEKQEQRRQIYRFMLENMMDDDRFKVTYRLCTDVLAGVGEEGIELSASGTTLLQDALYVLSCEEIRLAQLRPSTKETDDDDGTGDIAEVAQAINNLARKTLISQFVKKNMIENVVPIFIKLKHKLKQLKSPLVRDLMACLRELMKDYKTEINEILSADKELAAEIQHDLQNAEEEEDSGDDHREIPSEEILKNMDVGHLWALNEARKSLNSSKRVSPRVNKSMRLSSSSSASVKSTRVSPGSAKTSPGQAKSPASSSASSPTTQPTPTNGKQSSPSSTSDTSSVVQEPQKVPRRRVRRSSASSHSSEASVQSQSSRSSRRRR